MRAFSITLATWLLLLCAACASHPTPQPTAAARSADALRDGLDANEWRLLAAGNRVERAMEFEKDGARYVGGVAYQLVSAEPDVVLHALLDPTQLGRMLPRTRRVQAIGTNYPPTALEVSQGNEVVQATYSIVVEHDFAQRQIQFWLDRSRPSDIQDVWGYFRVVPTGDGKSLITVGAALDVGPGIVRLLFEDKIQQLILTTPTRMRDVLESAPPAPASPALARAR